MPRGILSLCNRREEELDRPDLSPQRQEEYLNNRTEVTARHTTQAEALIADHRAFGLKLVAGGIGAEVDIVAVHGLNGHRDETWTHRNFTSLLRDLLPPALPKARIYTFGYDASTHSARPLSTQLLYDHGKVLVSELSRQRMLTNTTKRPIIFLPHSLGGIVVKSALIHADSTRSNHLKEHRAIKVSTSGIFFLGTPHQGVNSAHWGEILVNIASIFTNASSTILKHLKSNSEWLQQQLSQYAAISSDFETKFGYEIYETPIALGETVLVVPKHSAVLPGAVNAEEVPFSRNHLDMVTFENSEDSEFQKLAEYLQLMAISAPSRVATNWMKEELGMQVDTSIHENLQKACELLACPEILNLVNRVTDAAPGTLSWVLHGDNPLSRWIASGRGLFWIQGKPGSGKSTLVKHLHRILRNESLRRQPAVFAISFHFSSGGTPIEKSFPGILRTILYHLFREKPSVFRQVKSLFKGLNSRQFMAESALKVMLLSVLKYLSQQNPLYVLFDGLDECQSLRRADVEYLENLGSGHGFLKILVASQPTPMLCNHFRPYPSIALQDLTQEDIATYTLSRLQHPQLNDIEKSTQLAKQIISRAHGVFFWVVRVVEEVLGSMEKGDTYNETRRRLLEVPDDLNLYLHHTIRRIPSDYAFDALLTFSLISGAMRSLDVTEFRYAMMFATHPNVNSYSDLEMFEDFVPTGDEMQRRLLSRCAGLVEVSASKVRFIHQSVQDFLLKSNWLDDLARAAAAPHNSFCTQQSLLGICAQALSTADCCSNTPNEFKTRPFVSYGVLNWVDHYLQASLDGSLKVHILSKFLDPSQPFFKIWVRLFKKLKLAEDEDDLDDVTIYHFAAQNSMYQIMKHAIDEDIDVHVKGGDFQWPLQAAVAVRDFKMAKLLVLNGADVNAEGGRFGTALAAAITLQIPEIVTLLKRNGALIDLCSPAAPSPQKKVTGYGIVLAPSCMTLINDPYWLDEHCMKRGMNILPDELYELMWSVEEVCPNRQFRKRSPSFEDTPSVNKRIRQKTDPLSSLYISGESTRSEGRKC